MMYFNMPGIVDHFDLNVHFLQLYEHHPEYFLPNRKFGTVYGNFHFSIWDGGRNFTYYKQYTKEQMQHIIFTYNEVFHVPIRYIFTNPVLKEEHLSDRFGNLALKLADNGMNEVVVNSALMEDYIRTKYPNYKIISSTTKRLVNTDKALEELKKDYYQVCLDYDLNKNNDFLKMIPSELAPKVELLCNAICPSDCKYRKMHYTKNGIVQLSFLEDFYSIPQCGITENINHPKILGRGNNLSSEDIDKYYNEYKFSHFKLEGRTLNSADMFANYLYYLVKPEYYFEMISVASTIPNIFYNDSNSPYTHTITERPPTIGNHITYLS